MVNYHPAIIAARVQLPNKRCASVNFISLLLIWYFFSLYSTYNPAVLLVDPNKKIFIIPLLVSALLLPFTEMLVYKILSFVFGIQDGGLNKITQRSNV